MDAGDVGLLGERRHLQPDAERDLAELAVDVLPLADAEVVEVLAPAHPPERARPELLPLLAEVAPEVEVGHEVGVGIGEAAVVGGGRLLLAGRALPRVLDRQGRREHEHLPHHAVAVGLEDHPGQPRVGGDAGQPAAELGEPDVVGGGSTRAPSAPSSSSSRMPSLMLRASGGSTNGNAAMSPRPSAAICRMTDARFVRRISGSVNSGRAVEVLLRVQADAGARRDAPAPARSLGGGRLRDRLDRAAAAPWCGGCTGRCGRCRDRSRRRCPGTVSDVSATLVASTMRRPGCGANTRCCSAADSRA